MSTTTFIAPALPAASRYSRTPARSRAAGVSLVVRRVAGRRRRRLAVF